MIARVGAIAPLLTTASACSRPAVEPPAPVTPAVANTPTAALAPPTAETALATATRLTATLEPTATPPPLAKSSLPTGSQTLGRMPNTGYPPPPRRAIAKSARPVRAPSLRSGPGAAAKAVAERARRRADERRWVRDGKRLWFL